MIRYLACSILSIAVVWSPLTPAARPSMATICKSLEGNYAYDGVNESPAGRQAISFLHALARPSRRDVSWFRLSIADVQGGAKLRVSLFDANSRSIGDDLLVGGQCVNESWEDHSSYDGSGDGARVKGSRNWRFATGTGGRLEVHFAGAAATYDLPGIASQARSATNVSVFLRKGT